MRRFKRIITIVLPSLGIGETADAARFGDQGADTLGHVCDYWQGSLKLPTLTKLGLGNIPRQSPLTGILAVTPLQSHVGKMRSISDDKDSLSTHWELMAAIHQRTLATFPNGFSSRLIEKIEKFSNRQVIMNRSASELTAIRLFGQQQLKEGDLIVYTSSDSVLQVSTNETVVSLAELYRICRYIRFVADEDQLNIGRVIACPFVGKSPSNFKLTDKRREYAMDPPAVTALDMLKQHQIPVTGAGQLTDLFSGRGMTRQIHGQKAILTKILKTLETQTFGLIIADLGSLDEDAHARDPYGYGKDLMQLDAWLNAIVQQLTPTDLLLITADHANDPTFKGIGHTREFVPLIAASPNAIGGQLTQSLELADVGATILANFGIDHQLPGKSFLNQIS